MSKIGKRKITEKVVKWLMFIGLLVFMPLNMSAQAIDEDDDELEFRLYPIGENEFGRKGGMIRLTFGKDCVMYNGFTCKKL